jgi:hypothetical protein
MPMNPEARAEMTSAKDKLSLPPQNESLAEVKLKQGEM